MIGREQKWLFLGAGSILIADTGHGLGSVYKCSLNLIFMVYAFSCSSDILQCRSFKREDRGRAILVSRWQSSAAGILSSSQLSTELSQGGRHCIRATWSTPDHRGPGPLRPVPLILLLPEGLALPSCCSPGLSLSPPRREKPPSLHVSSSSYMGRQGASHVTATSVLPPAL